MALYDPELDEERRRFPPVEWVRPLRESPFDEGPAPVSPGAAPLATAPPPPVSPIASGPAPVQAPAPLGERPGKVTNAEYAAVSPHGWRKGLGALFTGMAAYGSPEGGREAYQNLFVRPKTELTQQREREQADYDVRVAQREKEQQGAATAEERKSKAALEASQANAARLQTPEARAELAKQFNLTPDNPAYHPYVLTGTFPAERATPEAVQPLGSDRVEALNKGFQQRWALLHKEPIPANFQLPADASQRDFSNLDNLLDAQERQFQSNAQQSVSNGIRQQMLDLAKQGAEERKEKQGTKWMTWQEGDRQVAGPESMAKDRGATEIAEMPAQEVRDVMNARHAVRLMTKQGDPGKPETQGVIQLLDSLDKDGKLGILASRWNSFMTSGVGTTPGDDPRIITLINKNMLGDTATMLAHFGASGGRSPLMLQHFIDLANAQKMDGVTLKAGTKAIADYMTDRAMLPGGAEQGGGGGAAPGQPGSAEHAAEWLKNKRGQK